MRLEIFTYQAHARVYYSITNGIWYEKKVPIGGIKKLNAWLCVGGHKSIEYVDHWNTCSLVLSWNTVRLILVMALLNNCSVQSITFVPVFPTSTNKNYNYIKPPKVPKEFEIPYLPNFTNRLIYLYKLIKNLYGFKDAGKTCYDYLKHGQLKKGMETIINWRAHIYQ